jgi:hypothetical protein
VTSTKTLQYTYPTTHSHLTNSKRVIELNTTPAPARECLARGGKRKEREEKREEKKQEYNPAPKGNAKKPENSEKGKQKIENSKPRQTKKGQKN